MTWKRGTRPARIDKEKIVELHKQGKRQVEIAMTVGCSQGYVTRVLKDRTLELPGKSGGANPKARANAQRVLDYITTQGGTLRNALLQLNLNVCDATVRALAKEQKIDIAEYRYYQQRRSNWTVHKPGFRKREGSKHNCIPVRCSECGHEDELHYLQFQSSHPKVCENCGAC